jgi:hypothetical protein
MADPDTKHQQGQKTQSKWDPAEGKGQGKGAQDKGAQNKDTQSKGTAPGKSAGQDAASKHDDDARRDKNRGDQGTGQQNAGNAAGTDDEDFKTPASENENPDKDAQDPGKARDRRPM